MGVVIALRRRRRRHERIPLRQPVALVHGNGTVATAMAVDISPGGMRVRCDRATLDCLHPSDEPLLARHGRSAPPVRLDAHLKLPLTSGLVKLDVETQLVYAVPSGEGDFLVGLEFRRFHYAGESLVERYVDEARTLDALS